MRAIAIAFLTLLATASAIAQQPAARSPVSLETVQRVTRELSSDAFEGRAPGTAGETRTIAAISREFQRAGLQPGNHGSWVQDVPLVEITLQGSPQLQVTGGSGGPIALNYRIDYVGASYRAQPHIDVRDSQMVFVGYGINAPERGWND
jgi:hypothetical protein